MCEDIRKRDSFSEIYKLNVIRILFEIDFQWIYDKSPKRQKGNTHKKEGVQIYQRSSERTVERYDLRYDRRYDLNIV